MDPRTGEVSFWFTPDSGSILWFVATAIFFVAFLFFIKYMHARLVKKRGENAFRDCLVRFDLEGGAEESILFEMIERYEVNPATQLLTSLQTYDQVAGEEIARTQTAPGDLADRIERIESLYTIRLQAFADEPSVGGVEVLLDKPKDVEALKSPAAADDSKEDGPVETAPEVEPASAEPVEGSDTEEDEDFMKLLAADDNEEAVEETSPTESPADESPAEAEEPA